MFTSGISLQDELKLKQSIKYAILADVKEDLYSQFRDSSFRPFIASVTLSLVKFQLFVGA